MSDPTVQTPAPTPAPAAATPTPQAAPAAQPAAQPAPAKTETPAPAATPPAKRENVLPPVTEKPNETPPGETPPADPAKPEYKLPDAFKDKPWASKIKSEEDLFKQLDNLTAAVGKKQVTPDFETATPKELSDYADQVRGTADREEYRGQVTVPENVDPAEANFYKDLVFDLGVNPKVATPVIERMSNIIEAKKAELSSAEGFATEMKTRFGDNATDKDGPIGKVTEIIGPHLSGKDRDIWNGMTNETLGVVYKVINDITADYGISEGASARAVDGNSRGSNLATPEAIQTKMDANNQKLRDGQKNPTFTQEQKSALIKENNELAVKKFNMQNKANK